MWLYAQIKQNRRCAGSSGVASGDGKACTGINAACGGVPRVRCEEAHHQTPGLRDNTTLQSMSSISMALISMEATGTTPGGKMRLSKTWR